MKLSDRIEKGLWPPPPLKFSDIVECLIRTVETETWFPLKWSLVEGKPIREGGIIERKSSSKFIYRSYRHDANNSYLLAEQTEKVFTTSRDVVKYYLKWDLNLPGDLDGWQVSE